MYRNQHSQGGSHVGLAINTVISALFLGVFYFGHQIVQGMVSSLERMAMQPHVVYSQTETLNSANATSEAFQPAGMLPSAIHYTENFSQLDMTIVDGLPALTQPPNAPLQDSSSQRYFSKNELRSLIARYAPAQHVDTWLTIFWCESHKETIDGIMYADLYSHGDKTNGDSYGFIQARSATWAPAFPDYWELIAAPEGNMILAQRISRDWVYTSAWSCARTNDIPGKLQ